MVQPAGWRFFPELKQWRVKIEINPVLTDPTSDWYWAQEGRCSAEEIATLYARARIHEGEITVPDPADPAGWNPNDSHVKVWADYFVQENPEAKFEELVQYGGTDRDLANRLRPLRNSLIGNDQIQHNMHFDQSRRAFRSLRVFIPSLPAMTPAASRRLWLYFAPAALAASQTMRALSRIMHDEPDLGRIHLIAAVVSVVTLIIRPRSIPKSRHLFAYAVAIAVTAEFVGFVPKAGILGWAGAVVGAVAIAGKLVLDWADSFFAGLDAQPPAEQPPSR